MADNSTTEGGASIPVMRENNVEGLRSMDHAQLKAEHAAMMGDKGFHQRVGKSKTEYLSVLSERMSATKPGGNPGQIEVKGEDGKPAKPQNLADAREIERTGREAELATPEQQQAWDKAAEPQSPRDYVAIQSSPAQEMLYQHGASPQVVNFLSQQHAEYMTWDDNQWMDKVKGAIEIVKKRPDARSILVDAEKFFDTVLEDENHPLAKSVIMAAAYPVSIVEMARLWRQMQRGGRA